MRRPAPRTLQDTHVPATIAGIDSVSPASALGPSACHYAFNLIPDEKGVGVRPGFQEWVTDVHGAEDHTVRTVLPFTGSAKNGTADKLFAVTAVGIWDVTASTSTPTDVINFGTISGDAGFGTAVVMSTIAGRFLLYCDSENGLFIYSENTGLWTQPAGDTTQPWTAQTLYTVGDLVINGGNVYLCDTEGTSAVSGGPVGTGADETDGTARWDYVGAAQSSVIGPSLADQRLGYAADPSTFAFVTVWKGRPWFVERDTSRAWYLDASSIYGTATSFDFGSKLSRGGPLTGLWNWSYDGGNGLDTLLVGVSAAGDVVMYQGTDPSTAATFGIKGVWHVGAVPSGRRFVTDTGGELFIISAIGIVPLSRLVAGGEGFDQSNSLTRPIAPFFSRLVNQYAVNRGWTMLVHPTANCLLVIVPTSNSGDSIQLAYSYATKGWFYWRDLPMLSAATWNKELYFGTPDGRVCVQRGYVDDVKLSDSNDYDPVAYSGLGAFRNFGNAKNKQVQFIRTILDSDTVAAACIATARYDYNMVEPEAPSTIGYSQGSGWDVDEWDAGVWDGATVSQRIGGAVGMGRAVAIAFRGNAISRTVIIGFDVQWTEGGTL